jgi:hypothetical protein
MLAEDIP